ncbi:MAG: response regulator [bacterium]|nr:response regulator [bacterium]
MAATLSDVLGASGYGVETAYSGSEAVERVKKAQPDGILMDIRMPGMNGVETFRATKKLSPESFVIFMTAFSESSLVDDARREGAVEVVPKPIDWESLLLLIEQSAGSGPGVSMEIS